jgi:hypothetical protein
VDDEQNLAYFLLYNLSGKLCGFQRYNPLGYKERGRNRELAKNNLRYVTIVTRENTDRNIPHLAVYGLHTLDERDYVFVVEGVFDAVKLESLGEPVIAILTNAPKKFKNFFFILAKRAIVIRDDDKTSLKLNRIADISLVVPAPYKDLGEMPLEDVAVLIGGIK